MGERKRAKTQRMSIKMQSCRYKEWDEGRKWLGKTKRGRGRQEREGGERERGGIEEREREREEEGEGGRERGEEEGEGGRERGEGEGVIPPAYLPLVQSQAIQLHVAKTTNDRSDEISLLSVRKVV